MRPLVVGGGDAGISAALRALIDLDRRTFRRHQLAPHHGKRHKRP